VREVDRVDLLVWDEVGDLDRLVALDPRGREVLVAHVDVLAPLDLERLHDLVVRHGLLLRLADLLISDRRSVWLVDEVEVELVLANGAVEPNRHIHEPEGDRSGPDGTGHAFL
jgi:hypothetical protein